MKIEEWQKIDELLNRALELEPPRRAAFLNEIAVDSPELRREVESLLAAETDAERDGKITAEYSRGYKFGDKLLRPARVQVGKARAQSAGE